jgi:hypothetical protein
MILFGSLLTNTAIAPHFLRNTLLTNSNTSPNYNNLTIHGLRVTWRHAGLRCTSESNIILNQIANCGATGKSMRPGLKAFE